MNIVSVLMITYAHENYIEQAINAVLMQECDFEVELIITNDCSPDNTDGVIKKIIKNHPRSSWIKYIKHDKNIGMMTNFVFTFNEARGKYIAICEGDDYWTDPNKLQKQIDFLENNSEYNLVGHHATDSNSKLIGKHEKDSFSFEDIYYRTLIIPTASLVFRNNIVFEDWITKVYGGDKAIIFLNAKKGKLKILPFLGSFYRLHSGGIEQLYKDDLRKSIRNINEHIVYYNLTKHLPKSTVLRKKIIKNHVDIILYCIYTFRFSYLIKAPYSLFLFLTRGRIYIN
jgi:glycosyltransferase involved in cell wall biosynthesis